MPRKVAVDLCKFFCQLQAVPITYDTVRKVLEDVLIIKALNSIIFPD